MATECTAQSTHVAIGTNIITYTWTVDPLFTIVSGQGTDTIVISSTSDTNVTGDITCVGMNDEGTDSFTASVTHGHTFVDPAVDLTSGLVAHYLLNNNADDSFGAYDGTSNGNLFTGDVSTFDGTDDSISISASALTGTSGSVSGWSIGEGIVFSKSENSDVLHLLYFSRNSDTGWKFFIKTTSIRTTLNISTIISNDDLIHFAVVSTGSAYKIYINGVDTSFTVAEGFDDGKWFGDLVSSNVGLMGSLQWSSPDIFFTGSLSNFRIYSDAKDQTFIDDLYAEGYYPKPLTEPNTTGLIAHYPLTGTAEDSTGTYDSIENGVTYVDDAEFGGVMKTSGSDTVDSVAYNSVITRTLSDATTISFSIRINANNVSNPTYLIFFGAYYPDRFYIGASITNMTLGVGYGENQNVTGNSGISFAYGELLHITAIFNNGVVKLFKNSVEGFTDTYTPTLDEYRVATIGSYFHHLNLTFEEIFSPNCNISSVRIYNSELTQQEITDIYTYEKNFRSIDIDDGLVAYYPLANNSDDNYFNENDGTDTSVTYDGDSAVFDGTTSQISTRATNKAPTDLTVSAWIILTDDTNINVIYCDDDRYPVDSRSFQFNVNTLREIYYTVIGTSVTNIVSTNTINLNELVHVAFTHDESGLIAKIYINGVEDNSGVLTSGRGNGHKENIGVRRGATINDYLDYFNGNISNVRVYEKVLTPEQIEVIYNEELII